MDKPSDEPHERLNKGVPLHTTYEQNDATWYGVRDKYANVEPDDEPKRKRSHKEWSDRLYPKQNDEDEVFRGFSPRHANPKSYEEHVDWVSYSHKPAKVVNIVTRESWGAVEPLSEDFVQGPPLSKVVLFYTGMEPCFTKEECCVVMRKMQKIYMEEWHLSDIPWNFLIGCDGRVYEGRGWGIHPKKVNSLYKYRQLEGKSYDIAYIGPYYRGRKVHADERSLWPKLSFLTPMYHALKNLITAGVNADIIDDGFGLISQVNC
ncbi:peptidoglycan-recognition protein 1-like [Macrosteles quadrilineatus]|uniref:peptidoglycan-recognition protein 1-like n=1 Tax=Macrosteles quadrilineatus TaxID=74068 RepID=UPI0023E0B0BB|nr:peptidoglycan-recognition protein 1-like [Macrosteles quadrilineatus]